MKLSLKGFYFEGAEWGGKEMDKVIFDPRRIPPESADHLAAETLRLVRRMMKIPKYRSAIEKMNEERRRTTEEGRLERGNARSEKK